MSAVHPEPMIDVGNVRVLSANEAPFFVRTVESSIKYIDENAPAGTRLEGKEGAFVPADDPNLISGDALMWSMTRNDDYCFQMGGGALSSSGTCSFNYETRSSYSIGVRVTDSWGLFADMDVSVHVNAVTASSAATGIAGGLTCPKMNPFCPNDGTAYEFFLQGSSTTQTPIGDFGCLTNHPGEQWLWFEVKTAGNVVFDSTSPKDHDYAIWGPYASKAAMLTACSNLPSPKTCSYSPSNIEKIVINNAQAGDFFIYVLTNYANVDQSLEASVSTISPGNISPRFTPEPAKF